jgi:hypothetical protein
MSADTLRLVNDDATPASPAAPDTGYQRWQPVSPSPPLDTYGLGGSPYVRRIEPSPRPPRRAYLRYALIGLIAGLIVFGAAGYVAGRLTTRPAGTPVASPSPAPSYVAALTAANRAKFSGDLATLAGPWLGGMSGCTGDTDPGGPKLGRGEQVHVLCRDGGMYLHFVTYTSADEKAGDRGYRQQLALGTAAILAGNDPPGRRLGGVTGAAGTYIEYATRGPDTPALCGIWWDLDGTASAVYIELLCDSLGGQWDPLRSVWQLHS